MPEAPSEARSAIMRAVKSTNTKPEMKVRSLAHRLGFRFRLHRKSLPGRPDLVFVARRKAIFVNGCFWHGHDCKRGARAPKANAGYWLAKIEANRRRDARARAELAASGWESLTLWECEIRDEKALRARLLAFLAETSSAFPLRRLPSSFETGPSDPPQDEGARPARIPHPEEPRSGVSKDEAGERRAQRRRSSRRARQPRAS